MAWQSFPVRPTDKGPMVYGRPAKAVGQQSRGDAGSLCRGLAVQGRTSLRGVGNTVRAESPNRSADKTAPALAPQALHDQRGRPGRRIAARLRRLRRGWG